MAMYRYTTHSVSSLSEMKKVQTTKAKGDLFEALCKLILEKQHYHSVWYLKELPEDIREKLQLTRHDMGIDLIAQKDNDFFAIQCKYKSPLAKGSVPGTKTLRRDKVNWSELCTFIVLCTRSGPYKKHITMTNAVGIRRVGRRSSKDQSICLKTFQGLTKEFWYSIVGYEGQILGQTDKNENEDFIFICLT